MTTANNTFDVTTTGDDDVVLHMVEQQHEKAVLVGRNELKNYNDVEKHAETPSSSQPTPELFSPTATETPGTSTATNSRIRLMKLGSLTAFVIILNVIAYVMLFSSNSGGEYSSDDGDDTNVPKQLYYDGPDKYLQELQRAFKNETNIFE